MIEIFQNTFMVRAMLAGIIVAIIAPLIGIFLSIRRYPYLSDTLSHVSLVGVALATLLNIQPIIGAIAVTILAAWIIEYLRYKGKMGGESILSIFLSGSLAIALVIMSLAKGFNINFLGFLFGSITTISPTELFYIGIMGVIILLGIIVFFKKIFLVSVSEKLAEVEGVKVKQINMLFMTLAALTIGLCMRAVGVLLIGALMVIPVTAAVQLGDGIKKTLLWALIISVFSTFTGLFLSYYLNLPSGGAIVLVSLIIFFFLTILRKN